MILCTVELFDLDANKTCITVQMSYANVFSFDHIGFIRIQLENMYAALKTQNKWKTWLGSDEKFLHLKLPDAESGQARTWLSM